MDLSQYLLTRGTSINYEGGGTFWQPLNTNKFIIAAALAVADLPDDSEPVFNLYTLQISDSMAALVDARLNAANDDTPTIPVVPETGDVQPPANVTTPDDATQSDGGKHES